MKKLSAFFTCLVAAAIVNAQSTSGTATASSTAANNSASTTTAAPKPDIAKVLQFSEENHDFGKIPYGKPVEYDVLIKNIGQEPVKIENVSVSCGCTTPKYEQNKTLASGESAKVTLGFNGYTEGNFEKSVTINFNNGLSKIVKFHGTGYKVPEASAPANGAVQKLKNGSK